MSDNTRDLLLRRLPSAIPVKGSLSSEDMDDLIETACVARQEIIDLTRRLSEAREHVRVLREALDRLAADSYTKPLSDYTRYQIARDALRLTAPKEGDV